MVSVISVSDVLTVSEYIVSETVETTVSETDVTSDVNTVSETDTDDDTVVSVLSFGLSVFAG